MDSCGFGLRLEAVVKDRHEHYDEGERPGLRGKAVLQLKVGSGGEENGEACEAEASRRVCVLLSDSGIEPMSKPQGTQEGMGLRIIKTGIRYFEPLFFAVRMELLTYGLQAGVNRDSCKQRSRRDSDAVNRA